MPELWLLMGACGVVTYMWRGLGVLLSGRIATDSDAFDWITCVAYAMVAGCPAKIIGWMSAYGDVIDFTASDTCTDSQGHLYRKISNSQVERVK